MKTILKLLTPLLALTMLSCSDNDSDTLNIPDISQEDCLAKHFYYYDSGTINKGDDINYSKVLIGFYGGVADSHIIAVLDAEPMLKNTAPEMVSGNDRYRYVIAEFTTPKTCPEIHRFIGEMKAKNSVAFGSYVYDEITSYTDEFLVKVYDSSNLTALEATADQTNTVIIGELGLTNWFLMSANENSAGDALDMTNYFYETGFFENTDPNFLDSFSNE